MKRWALALVGAGVLAMLATDASARGDGPEISRSRGKRGGVVVLWPRVVPETTDPSIDALALRLQQKLYAASAQVVDVRLVNQRPAPERVCPQTGCKSASVGLLLAHREGGCIAAAIVGPPGVEPQKIVPLAGQLEMVDDTLPFRGAPEQRMIIKEFTPCVELEAQVDPMAIAELLRAYTADGR